MTKSPLAEALEKLHVVEVPMSAAPTPQQMDAWYQDLKPRVDHPHFVLRWRGLKGKYGR